MLYYKYNVGYSIILFLK